MGMERFGRTNESFAPRWLRLVTGSVDSAHDVVQAALKQDTVIDISTNPGLWGGQMRGTVAKLMALGISDLDRATGDRHAADLLDAHLIQILSSIGREWIDFYFLPILKPLRSDQLQGALSSLENARQDGHVRHLGIYGFADKASLETGWRNADAFEALWLMEGMDPEVEADAIQMANERRVGVVSRHEPVETPIHGLARLEEFSLVTLGGGVR